MKFVKFLYSLAIALALLTTYGCEVNSDEIRSWKQSEKGPPKIRAALRDTRQKLPVRLEAALALAELGLFQPLSEDLHALGQEDRRRIATDLTARLTTTMTGANPKATTRPQVQAKDALFSIRELAPEEQRRLVDRDVIEWILGDWDNRSLGEHSAEKVITTIGVTAGSVLAERLDQPGVPLVAVATLVAQIADAQTRDRAADRLLALARREKPITMETFHALGKIGGVRATSFLASIAGQGAFLERLLALRALALEPTANIIEEMAAIAGDSSLKGEQAELRDAAFAVLEKIDDPRSLAVLVGFLKSKEEIVRYRAVEAITEGFGAKGLPMLLEGLPSTYTFKKQDLEDFIEKDIKALGTKALPALRAALSSQSWVARVVGVRLLGEIGSSEDLPGLEKLKQDNTRLRGWEGGATIATEAKAAAEKISSRAPR